MTDALFIHIKGMDALSLLPEKLAQRAQTQWQKLQGQTALMDKELQFCRDHNIQVLCYTDEAYPERLKVLADAPLVLFYLGRAPLNKRPIVSIVGTRRITPYGKDMCRRIAEDLRRLVPDVLIVSGLAYGVDIHAHRGALANGCDTVAVLAHGLDRIYPYTHKETAAQMTRQGGLLTEYPTGTEPERYNFVHRNRIVAAMSDCTIVVESALRGGSMITASRARELGKRLFCCPGRITDEYSAGCNDAIAQGLAQPFVSVETLVNQMGWENRSAVDAREQSLFATVDREAKVPNDLSPEAQGIVAALREAETLTADQLATSTALPIHILTAELMDLEMMGCVEAMAGARYRLLR